MQAKALILAIPDALMSVDYAGDYNTREEMAEKYKNQDNASMLLLAAGNVKGARATLLKMGAKASARNEAAKVRAEMIEYAQSGKGKAVMGGGGGSNKKFETKSSLNRTHFTGNSTPVGDINPVSESYIEKLKKKGFNAEREKEVFGTSKVDIFKDSKGNLFVAPKRWKKSDGLDSLTPTMKNIKDFSD